MIDKPNHPLVIRLQGLGYAILMFVFRIPSLLTVLAMASFGSGVVRPVLTSLVTQRASREEQGAVLGVNQSLVSIAQVLAPILSGYLIGKGYLDAWALSVGGFALCGLAIAWLYER